MPNPNLASKPALVGSRRARRAFARRGRHAGGHATGRPMYLCPCEAHKSRGHQQRCSGPTIATDIEKWLTATVRDTANHAGQDGDGDEWIPGLSAYDEGVGDKDPSLEVASRPGSVSANASMNVSIAGLIPGRGIRVPRERM